MTKICMTALALLLAAGTAAYAKGLPAEAKAGVTKALTEMACTVEADDITAKGDGFKADDVQCKDGQYDITFDKDFKVTNKKKED